MNKFYFTTFLLFFIAGSFVLNYNCASEGQKTEEEIVDSTAENEFTDAAFGDDKNMAYKLPSPIELYLFLKNHEARYDKEVLNSIENIEKYIDNTSKAINFGIYASDLAYSTVFEEPQKTFFYYKTVKQLADELGLVEGFDETITQRINDNINNTDSLYEITSDAYWEACNHLEAIGKSDVLTYIIIGGWLESVYIAINSVDKFSNKNKIVIRISEQQLLLENLLDHMRTIEKDDGLNNLTEKLEDLQLSFDKLYDNAPNVTITKEQFNEIALKVTGLRNDLIK